MKLILLFFLGMSFAQDSTLSHGSFTIGSRKVQWDAPVFPLNGGCRGIRADTRGNGVFGATRDNGGGKHHSVDWFAPIGTVIKSPWPGRVEASHSNGSGGAGDYIQILHSNGLTTTYAHLEDRYVAVGARVTRGQPIGTLGNTGNARHRAMIPHVHFTLKYRGNPIDPTQPGFFRCGSYSANSVPSKRTAGVPVCKTPTRCR